VVEEPIELRTRIDTLEMEATTAFNERMADLLDILDYETVERSWLERLDGPAGSVATVDAGPIEPVARLDRRPALTLSSVSSR